MPNYPYDPIDSMVGVETREKINGNWKKIESDIKNIAGDVLAEVIDGAKLIWKEPVDTFADLATTYPDAETGFTAMTRDTGKVYRFDGTDWLEIQDIDPTAINEVDSRLTSQLAQIVTLPNGTDKTGIVSARSILQSILNSGRENLYLPEGDYYLDYSEGATELLLVTKPIKIIGAGIGKTKIYVDGNTPDTCDVIRVSPDMTTDGLGYGFSGFSIMPKTVGCARHGINLDVTNVGQRLKSLIIEQIQIADVGGHGIQTTNPTNVDGIFTSTIRDCVIRNGIYLERAGDSLRIERNTLSGANYGIYADLVSGANNLVIIENNITSRDGAIYVNGGETDPRIMFNNLESVHPNTGVDSALVVLKGGSGKLRTPTVAFNTFMMINNHVTNGLIVDNVQWGLFENNYFGRSNPTTQKAIVLTPNANNNWISKNFISGASADSGYEDNGVRTKGIYKTLTLSAGFIAKTDVDQPSYSINDAGNVNLIGVVNRADAWADAQIIAVLPSSARPKATQYFTAACFITNVGYSTVTISIESTGNVKIWGVNAKPVEWVSLSGINFLGYA